jgi:hypothetical protein
LKVHITLHNAETMIEPCVRAVKEVFPDVTVHDFGSEDSGPELVSELGVELVEHGRLSGEDYVLCKEDVSTRSDYVFWIDGDEVWPEDCLRNMKDFAKRHPIIVGFWRNLKIRQNQVYASDFIHRGAVAWDTARYRIHRTWPREKMSSRHEHIKRGEEEYTPKWKASLFCWHGVLLNISHLPDKKGRWKKRAERDDQSANLEWTPLEDLPFSYEDNRILEQPKFEWYK